MGKKFTRGVVSVVLIVASYVIDYYYPGAGNYVRALSAGLMAAGISGLANLAIGALFGPRRPGPPPINVTIRGSIEYRRLVFGTVRTGGVLVHYGTTGSNAETLWYVIAYAAHQSSAFHDFWLDERRIDEGIIPSGSGGVVSASPWNSKIAIYKHLGLSSQSVDSNLDSAFTEWTSAHTLSGITYAAIKMSRDETVFPDGAPSSVSCELDGMLTYDARSDSTNGGSGSQRYGNPTTWAFSRDPVQHVRWYMTGGSVHNDSATPLVRYGCGESNARMDDAYTVASSNICDENITGIYRPPSGDQPRYRCDLEVHCGETRREILEALLVSMAGTLIYVRGKWRILAGAYDVPTHTLSQDDIYDNDFQVDDTVGHDKRYNAVAPIFIDSSQQYVQTTGLLRTDSDYETQDGGERIPITLSIDAVKDQYQAQRLAEIRLRKSRMMRSITIPGALNLLPVALFETFTFSHERYGWTNRVFRCMTRNLRLAEGAGRIDVIAQREDSAVYADILTADYTTGTSSTDQYQTDGPSSPTSLTTTSVPTGIKFVVGLPSDFRQSSIVEIWEYTSSTPFSSATRIAQFSGDTYIISHRDTTTRYYWVRIRDPKGALSGTFPATTGQAAVAVLVSANSVVDTPSDGNVIYSVATQPVIEAAGLSGHVSYTAPSGVSTGVQVSWSAQAQISNTTSGVAVGYARILSRVFVNGSQVYSQDCNLEGCTTASAVWGSLSGSRTYNINGGDTIDLYLDVGRNFSTSGSSPAQTITWRQALLDLMPLTG